MYKLTMEYDIRYLHFTFALWCVALLWAPPTPPPILAIEWDWDLSHPLSNRESQILSFQNQGWDVKVLRGQSEDSFSFK